MAETTIEISKIREDLALSMKESIEKLRHVSPTLAKSCIFRVPKKLRQHKDNNVFDPIIVSIGPFHQHGDGLARMEQIKWWYLKCLCDRYTLPLAETLELFLESISTSLKRAREYYAESIELSDTKFIEMMVVDGCFLIELFRKNASLPLPQDDPIFSSQWNLERLRHDLILLENQIPWFVLQKLFDLLPGREQVNNTALSELVLCFFDSMMLMDSPAYYTRREGQEIMHILDLLRSCLLFPSVAPEIMRPLGADYQVPSETKCPDIMLILGLLCSGCIGSFNPCEGSDIMLPLGPYDQNVPSVTDLLQSGVKFKAGASGDIFNIKFSNGVLKIPPILIKSNSESLFRNLIAYEQCDYNCTIQFTSYALFLDCLIDTVKDVAVLYRAEILKTELNVEDTSLLFNKLYNDTLVHRCYYREVSREINEHCDRWVSSQQSRCHRWIAILKNEYFSNPWKISKVLAAILILIFTGIETVIAMLGYYNVPHF